MRKFTITLVTLGSLAIASTSSMAAIFSDDFDGDAGSLTGQTADTGQTWGNFTFFGTDPSFSVGTDFGNAGTEGAGSKGAGSGFAGNTINFAGVSSGLVRFQVDWTTITPGFSSASTPLQQFWLNDPVNGTNASLEWITGGSTIDFQGLSFADTNHPTGQTLNSTASMHVILDIDLTNKTVQYSWSGVDSSNIPFSGSVNLGTYTANFAPSRLHIWGRGESNVIVNGWDNIDYSVVPEPSAMAVIGAAGLGLLRRRACRQA